MKSIKTTLAAAALAFTLSTTTPVQAGEFDTVDNAQTIVQIMLVVIMINWLKCQFVTKC